jgi:hypothetical protein
VHVRAASFPLAQTPFLNIIMKLRLLKDTDGLKHTIVKYIFILLWIVFRLGLCGYAWRQQYILFGEAFKTLAAPMFYFWLAAVPFFNFLNWLWFSKIVHGAMYPYKPKPE